ncbi:hypothetical protein GUJ93_ZPchr0001g31516 [Zizania palustris]|uniref:Uncharacterized protein n=1 Tax=Zizania palustris TaxID=103762 RepID=A0A8J5R567_ZIZPA|nr:hypothetical protein GUJ93_ZPchr0001g31516 [Zizania palustris]
MTRGEGRGGKETAEDGGKVMGPLFPRLHVNDAARSGGPRAPPRNKMALYEQLTVPSHRSIAPTSNRSGGGSSLVPSTSASQVCGFDGALFQPFNVPLNGPGHSMEKINSNSINRQINGSRKDSGMLFTQTKGMDNYASGSVADLECITGWKISPDQVVCAIGRKHFWKARRAIMNQQRVFSAQVFELHKLVKVQKLIAASPHVLIEGDPCLGNALLGSKNKLAEENLKAQPLLVACKDDVIVQPSLEEPELLKEYTEENPLSPHVTGLGGSGHRDQAETNDISKSNLQATPVASDNIQNNWGIQLQPPQNQWLVPVMSPSEGLVYKPYSGPCPPAGSLLAPFYGDCTPLSLPSTTGDFMNSAYGVPVPHRQQHIGAPVVPMNYFPPFTVPVMNPVALAPAVEQGTHPSMPQPYGNFEQHSRISCNMARPSGIWRFHASRDGEAQASSASSPFDRLQCGVSGPVSAFPTASVQNNQPQLTSGSQDNQTNVIRFVNVEEKSFARLWLRQSYGPCGYNAMMTMKVTGLLCPGLLKLWPLWLQCYDDYQSDWTSTVGRRHGQ